MQERNFSVCSCSIEEIFLSCVSHKSDNGVIAIVFDVFNDVEKEVIFFNF
jgi:hypothetical protein